MFYLPHGFREQLLKELLSNIEQSLRQRGRDIFVGYVNPVHQDFLHDSGFLQLLEATDRYPHLSLRALEKRRVETRGQPEKKSRVKACLPGCGGKLRRRISLQRKIVIKRRNIR